MLFLPLQDKQQVLSTITFAGGCSAKLLICEGSTTGSKLHVKYIINDDINICCRVTKPSEDTATEIDNPWFCPALLKYLLRYKYVPRNCSPTLCLALRMLPVR